MLKRLLFLLVLLFSANISFAQTDDARIPVIIDTDMAMDDWMAMLYLLQHPNVEVRAILVGGTGETHCEPGVRNALNIAALAGNPDIPVTCGRETPLQGDHVFPTAWRDGVDALSGITLAENPNSPSELNAPELLIELISTSDEQITLLTLGPLTNIAEAFQAEPTLVNNITRIYIMGGAVNVPGNVMYGGDPNNTTAEWNLYIDPLAASIVFASGAPITLVGLDATNHVPVNGAFYSRIANDRTTPEAEFAYQAMSANIGEISAGTLSFWDTLTAVAITNPEVISIQGRPISIVTEEGSESGRTIVDGDGVRMDVAVNADAAAFELIFLNVLNGRDPTTEPRALITVAEGSEANAAIVERYLTEVWGEQNWDTLNELISESYILHNNSDGFLNNRDGILSTVTSLHQMAPDLQVQIEEIIVVGDTAAVRFVLRGTNTVGFGQLEPTGSPIVIVINSILHLSEGKIIEEWQTYDWFNLFVSLGLLNYEVLAPLLEGDEP